MAMMIAREKAERVLVEYVVHSTLSKTSVVRLPRLSRLPVPDAKKKAEDMITFKQELKKLDDLLKNKKISKESHNKSSKALKEARATFMRMSGLIRKIRK